MKSNSGDDDIELASGRVPFVEIGDNGTHLRKRGDVFRKQACEIGATLDCGEPDALPSQRDRELSRTRADLEHLVRLLEPSESDKVGDQRLRIGGARARVQIGDLVERFGSAKNAWTHYCTRYL